jgi:hypothetical protein
VLLNADGLLETRQRSWRGSTTTRLRAVEVEQRGGRPRRSSGALPTRFRRNSVSDRTVPQDSLAPPGVAPPCEGASQEDSKRRQGLICEIRVFPAKYRIAIIIRDPNRGLNVKYLDAKFHKTPVWVAIQTRGICVHKILELSEIP